MSVAIRAMTAGDLRAVSAIHVTLVGEAVPADWRASVGARLEPGSSRRHAALVAIGDHAEVVGYVVGEVRTWEFGSPPAGWITGLGVDPAYQGRGVASALVTAIVSRLRRQGATRLRTMARRDDVAVLRLFRSAGFAAGPYTELELDVEASDARLRAAR